ncbi:putative low temperature essential 1 [Phaeomoniella chlamydospora]|uniref:Putative low temperature essential 1 n=1 Tax=Phaeomoniella chlamydospora TaxID=158046 RepID=A0A0G2EL47_PHACM|nr:putative low temperature essential 1 [Phaeomoniella chlamydospora]
MYSVKEPIEPSIFDTLTTCLDDPSVVRYSSKTKEITAATPARIIAQITSESFMDYDLVSAFFLTFRSYLSCENVLNLLLARLRWAINRLQDDGRIIRIRTFAAIRHWILNYFLDDFVGNENLRIMFCDQINGMYREVKARENGGRSDLKILIDLKRCWNGRCSMVWDFVDPACDRNPDRDITPGALENDVHFLDIPPQKQAFDRNSGLAMAIQDRGSASGAAWIDDGEDDNQGVTVHVRQKSKGSEQNMPISPTSEYSLQPMSCSLPRSTKRTSPSGDHFIGPHPVPLQIKSGMTLQSKTIPKSSGHAHKRSASFTDSVRDDRDSTEDVEGARFAGVLVQSGSLIRGRQFPPGDAVVNLLPPSAQAARLSRFDLSQRDSESLQDSALKAGAPGMKNFMGSIRRALSSRQGGSVRSRSADGSFSNPSLRGKTSTLPLNIIFYNDAIKDRKPLPSPRRHARIDLLCAEVHESFQLALSHAENQPTCHGRDAGIASGNGTQQIYHLSPAGGQEDIPANCGRLPSQITTGSRSIVIVDDTGHEMPTMSGALPLASFLGQGDVENANPDILDANHGLDWHHNSRYSIGQRSSGVLGLRRSASAGPSATLRYSAADLKDVDNDVYGMELKSMLRRSSSVGASRRLASLRSPSTGLRRYASYQSSVSRHKPGPSLDNTATTMSASFNSPERPPTRLLRRRPGGDLKKYQNVHDLEPAARPHSMLSFDAVSDSAAGSMLLMASHARTDMRKDSAGHAFPERTVSLMRTHSSQRMRASFEAVVKDFAQIPDDEDGGLEATLLKLEGKYVKRSPDLSVQDNGECDNQATHSSIQEARQSLHDGEDVYKEDQSPDLQHGPDQDLRAQLRPDPSPQTRFRTSFARRVSPIFGLATASIATGSDASYSSIPLLERGLRDESMQKPQERAFSDGDMPRPLFTSALPQQNLDDPGSSHPSIEMVEETDSMKRIPMGSSMPDELSKDSSFLLDAEDRLSDLSSELSVDVIEYSEVEPRAMSPFFAPPGTAVSGIQIPSHPLAHPPTPPFTGYTTDPLAMSINPAMHQQLPLTPGPSPTMDQKSDSLARDVEAQNSRPIPQVVNNLGHVAFILAYDSEQLAQQFTIVEKAAISEVDWTDLVDMKWDNRSPAVLNWVHYLREKDHKGIDLVTARFNIMVKWVVSQVVMTQDIHERARTIIKYIHVAANARKIRNYATMLQIVIGLTSTDCTRLKKTWDLIPGPDQRILKEMELLIQPVRNFHALRDEMETNDLQEGCIPFVGLYVHDLTYNAQKPAQIASTRDGEPLINFERYRTAAAIVKNLLRLIDLSTKYHYRPLDGLIQRCLWMAALPDSKIRILSQSLE